MTLTTLLLLLIAAETSYLTYSKLTPKQKKIDAASVLLDTSVLIDGRIESIARSGIMTAKIVIPRSVIRELQYMADKADHDKRERARFGLDMIEKLQALDTVTVSVIEDEALTDGGVDERLVSLALSSGARLCTTDYNLNKAARVQGVTVLNINEIAHALRIVRLPGEQVSIYLQQPGQERDQAVGHLDDGTMVVVDNGKSRIGTMVEVEVTRALQTVAGKMLFAKVVGNYTSAEKTPAPKPVKSQPVPKKKPMAPRQPQPQRQSSPQPAAPKTEVRPAKRRGRKTMTEKAEDSFIDLANKQ